MTCFHAPGFKAMICIYPEYWMLDRNGKEWHFEYHPYCGPALLKKDGGIKRAIPGEKSPFWDAFQAWVDQGQKSEVKDGKPWAIYGAVDEKR